MKLSKFTAILAILLISILAIGAVSAESVDDTDIVTITEGDGGDIQESIEPTESIDNIGTADTADMIVEDDGSAVRDEGANSYDLDDDSYSTYFNVDGTTTGALSADGNYSLNLGTLTNKDIKIDSGSNINITAKDGAGFINNGTITIGDGAGSAGSIIISGLTFTNINKDGIVVKQYSNKVTIDDNKFNLTYDSSYSDSPMAIVTKGYVDETTITNNKIIMNSAADYTYGIDLAYYITWTEYGSSNAEHFYLANNDINIVSTTNSGMGEGMYLDSIINSVIENNYINVVTENAAVANYGMQVSDSWGFLNTPFASSPYNITIKNNTVVLDSADMAYGITVISLWPYDEAYETIVKDITISANDVTINSQTGAVGIGAKSSDVSITDNKVNISADVSKDVQAYADPAFGNESYAIFVNNFDKDNGYYVNNTVTGNIIVSNVQAIKTTKDDDNVQPLTIENNEIQQILIDDDTYDTYFNVDGTIKDDAPISANYILLLGDLNDKKLVIDIPLTINAVPNKKLVNSIINLIAGADNTVIEGLTMEFTGDENTGSVGIIYIKEVSNVTISNNKITVPNFVDKPDASWGSSVYAIEVESGALGCNDIIIANNLIDIKGNNSYLYGIDVFQTWGSENRNKNINVFENNVTINGGSRMAEGIYISASDDVVVNGNNICTISDGAAYGIATDQLKDAMITSNNITAESATMAYGITATTSGSNVTIRGNDVNTKGTGAVGVGINKQDGITIEDNTIVIDGGDFTTITSYDSLGTANAAILVGEGNTNIKLSGNNVSETSAVRLNSTIEVNNLSLTAAPSGNGNLEMVLKTISGSILKNQTINVVFNNQMFELTTDDKGVARLPFALNKAGIYNVNIFYLGDDNYRGFDTSAKITINKLATKTSSADKTYLATLNGKTITATLKDAKGNVLANKALTFVVNGKSYTVKTNAKGIATLKLSLTAAKTYTVSIKFAGDSVYDASAVSAKFKLNKEKTKITAPKKTFKKSAKTKKVVITLKNSKGKAIAKKKVTLIVNKKKYTVKTNKKGKASIKVKLTKKGTFKYTVKFAGDSQYKSVKKAGKIRIK
ncbi:Ig-like domain-containing protein [Methanobrevibacter olleyae]|nr:Ig-like domain repeat protein [Methanobrevibacter olleyae]